MNIYLQQKTAFLSSWCKRITCLRTGLALLQQQLQCLKHGTAVGLLCLPSLGRSGWHSVVIHRRLSSLCATQGLPTNSRHAQRLEQCMSHFPCCCLFLWHLVTNQCPAFHQPHVDLQDLILSIHPTYGSCPSRVVRQMPPKHSEKHAASAKDHFSQVYRNRENITETAQIANESKFLNFTGWPNLIWIGQLNYIFFHRPLFIYLL